jgi:glyoxylase-like metal-dependent hydrolase (beta-lactamase superfamily II)
VHRTLAPAGWLARGRQLPVQELGLIRVPVRVLGEEHRSRPDHHHGVAHGSQSTRARHKPAYLRPDRAGAGGQQLGEEADGHTSGHCAYHLPGQALVIEDFPRRTHPPEPQLMHPDFAHDSAQAPESVQRLRDIAADVIIPGHGMP